MIDTVYRNCGQKETVIFCDRIMATRLHANAFKAGISFGKDDMVVPETKESDCLRYAAPLRRNIEQQYNDGLITQGEKYNKVVDAWMKCTDKHRRGDDAAHLRGADRQGRAWPSTSRSTRST